MIWHIECDVFALAIYIIMLVKSLSWNADKTHQERGFDVVLRCSMAVTVVDLIAIAALLYSHSWWASHILMDFAIAVLPMLAMTWDCYAIGIIANGDNKWAWRSITSLAIPFLMYVISVFTDYFTSWFFTITPDLTFIPGPLFLPVTVGMVMFYCIVGVLLTLHYRSRVEPRSHVAILLAAFGITAGSVWVQALNPGLLVVCASSAVVLVMCDATIQELRRRLLTEELSTAVDDAQRANNAKTQFFARMSHDMRTPLNGILGLSTIIKSKVNDSDVISDLSQLSLSGKYLLHLVNDTLDISKIESGQMSLRPLPTDPISLASNVGSNAKTQANANGVVLVMKTPDLATIDRSWINIDGARLEQVLMNIISNAIKFTPAGSKVTLTFDSHLNDDDPSTIHYMFKVTDEGCGMEEDFLPHLFDAYSQEDRTAGKTQGTGLGMSIVKQLVDLMNGTIQVQSKVGKGTTIQVDFDFERCEGADTVEPVTDFSALKGKTALLVEDNPINARIAMALLDMKGMKSEWRDNGEKGVKEFNESEPGRYDVILMDIRMPVMDGIEAAKAIRALDRPDATEIPIIAMTANAFEEDVRNTREAGMNYHLAKPVDPDALYAAIAGFIS